MTTMKFNNGDRVKDKVTGYKGIIVGRTQWLNGCNRYAVQAEDLKDGLPKDNQHFDEPQLDLVKAEAVSVNAKPTGGPRNDAKRQANPVR